MRYFVFVLLFASSVCQADKSVNIFFYAQSSHPDSSYEWREEDRSGRAPFNEDDHNLFGIEHRGFTYVTFKNSYYEESEVVAFSLSRCRSFNNYFHGCAKGYGFAATGYEGTTGDAVTKGVAPSLQLNIGASDVRFAMQLWQLLDATVLTVGVNISP